MSNDKRTIQPGVGFGWTIISPMVKTITPTIPPTKIPNAKLILVVSDMPIGTFPLFTDQLKAQQYLHI